jgi:hypothetical protein
MPIARLMLVIKCRSTLRSQPLYGIEIKASKENLRTSKEAKAISARNGIEIATHNDNARRLDGQQAMRFQGLQ